MPLRVCTRPRLRGSRHTPRRRWESHSSASSNTCPHPPVRTQQCARSGPTHSRSQHHIRTSCTGAGYVRPPTLPEDPTRRRRRRAERDPYDRGVHGRSRRRCAVGIAERWIDRQLGFTDPASPYVADESLRVPMADGVELLATLYRDSRPGPQASDRPDAHPVRPQRSRVADRIVAGATRLPGAGPVDPRDVRLRRPVPPVPARARGRAGHAGVAAGAGVVGRPGVHGRAPATSATRSGRSRRTPSPAWSR